jgi:hypothetical protein
MSTRSIIVITGKSIYNEKSTTRLYKHCDGYPTDVLRLLENSIKLSKKIQKEQNKRYKDNKPISQELFEGAVVSCSLTPYGLGTMIEESFGVSFEKAFRKST